MEFREWPLLVFTILMQTAVGAFTVLWVAQWVLSRGRGTDEIEKQRSSVAAFAILVVIAGAGILASFFHLGNLRNAPYAFNNLATSWLSREIALSVLFAGALVVYTLLVWRRLGNRTIRAVAAVVTMLLGFALIFAQARAYMLVTIPIWNNAGTPMTFFLTTIILGALGASLLLAVYLLRSRAEDPECAGPACQSVRTILRWTSLLGIAGLAVLLVVTVMQLAYFAGAQVPGGELLQTRYTGLLILRLVLAILGAGLFGLLLNHAASLPGRVRAIASYAVMAFVVAFASELIGRYLFYATFSRIGL